jgi:cytochrome b|uniref:cytochrome b/b6 domain-containing protein n=1 Tax=Orrella sp. TaxID=1921583 RepID=UPI0040470DC5
MKTTRQASTRIWDLPTRLFHWLFAAAVIGAIVTVKVGGSWMDWHLPFGVTALVLLTFRVIWGFTGSRYARFSSFVKGPRAVWHYLRHPEKHSPAGHSPLGGLSVVALLLVVAVQAGTGLFATDDILTSGPLNQFVSSDTAALLTSIHKWNENILFGLIGLHLLAIAIYALRGKQLVPPMITGDVPLENLPSNTVPAHDTVGLKIWALALIVVLGWMGWKLVNFAKLAPMGF